MDSNAFVPVIVALAPVLLAAVKGYFQNRDILRELGGIRVELDNTRRRHHHLMRCLDDAFPSVDFSPRPEETTGVHRAPPVLETPAPFGLPGMRRGPRR